MIATTTQTISIPNTIEEIQLAISAFEEFAKTYNFSLPIMLKTNIVLDELLSNIIKYGIPPGKENHQIDISIQLSNNGQLTIKLSDQGIPFNPFLSSPPDLDTPLEEREIGGLGIHLVKQLMDSYNYKRELECNVVSMVKNKI